MQKQRPSFDNFKRDIENLFGQKLTGPAIEASEDFWNNWAGFDVLIARRQLSIHVDPFFLAINFPEY